MTIARTATRERQPFDELLALTPDPVIATPVCVHLAEAHRSTDPALALEWAAQGLAIAEHATEPRLELDALRAATSVAMAPVPSHRAADLSDRLERLARRERSATHLVHALLVRRALARARGARPTLLRPVEPPAAESAVDHGGRDVVARSPLARATASGHPSLIADALSHALVEMWLTDTQADRPARRAAIEAWSAAVRAARAGRAIDGGVDAPPAVPGASESGSPLTEPPPSVLWLAQLLLDADRARVERDARSGRRLLDLLWPHRTLSGSLGDALGVDSIWLAIGAAAEAAGDLGLATESYDTAARLRPAGADPFRSLVTSVRQVRAQALAA